jgi:hypothetical protein
MSQLELKRSFMPRPKLDTSKAASVLMDSHFFPDAEVAKTHGVSLATLKRYRQRVLSDPQLAAEFQKLKTETLTPARLSIEDAIANAVQWVDETMKELPRTIESMDAVRKHVQSLHEIAITSKYIEAKFPRLLETDKCKISPTIETKNH